MSLVPIELSVTIIVEINFDRSVYICVHRTRCTGRPFNSVADVTRTIFVTIAVWSLHECKLKVFNKTKIHSTRKTKIFSNEDRSFKQQKESYDYYE